MPSVYNVLKLDESFSVMVINSDKFPITHVFLI